MHIAAQAFAVEPGFAAVDVADVDEVLVRFVLGGCIVGDDEHMVVGMERDADGVVEDGGRGVGVPVDGIDGKAGVGNEGLDVFHILDGVVADGDSCIGFAQGWSDAVAGGCVVGCHLVAHDVGGDEVLIRLVVHVFEQFDHGHSTLAKTCEDERTYGVAVVLEGVEGLLHIVHGQTGTVTDGVVVLGHPAVYGGVAVERCIEIVAVGHVGCYFVHFGAHTLTVSRVPHVGIVADASVVSLPVGFPRRDDVEDVGSCTVAVVLRHHPHGAVGVVGWCRYPFSIVFDVLPLKGHHGDGSDNQRSDGPCNGFLFHLACVG